MAKNVLKALMHDAWKQAESSLDALRPGYGAPLASTLDRLDDAWQSPSQERKDVLAALTGAAAHVTSAFDGQGQHAWAEYTSEPAEVDEEDDAEAWKADASRIASRASVPYGSRY